MSECKTCKAPIMWVETKNGKKMPLKDNISKGAKLVRPFQPNLMFSKVGVTV